MLEDVEEDEEKKLVKVGRARQRARCVQRQRVKVPAIRHSGTCGGG